jgi:diguanylate cyclase (GGDEF)-like protein
VSPQPLRAFRRLQRLPTTSRRIVVFGVVFLVCMADVVLTRPSVQMIGYYLLPILLAAWLCGQRITAIVTALSLAANLLVTYRALPADAPAWEAVVAYASTLIVLAGFALLAVGMRGVFLRLERERNTDALTGLRNRRSFLEIATYELAASARRGTMVSLASIDLDDFKRVNDTLGHAAGDRLLVEIAEGLRRTFRGSDCIGRIGGDEFAVLLPGAGGTEAAAILEKLEASLQPVFGRFGDLAGMSVGLVSTPPRGSMTVDALMASADERMYATKRKSKSR